MRKIILMAVAGFLWKKFKASRTAVRAPVTAGRPFGATRPVNPISAEFP